ncbi:MAG: ABC transporter ATP-binding protein [Aureispira sp.]
MQKFTLLFAVLDRWKGAYLGAGMLLAFSSLVRMLEPKVLQLVVDGVLQYAPNPAPVQELDVLAAFFQHFLPEAAHSSASWFLWSAGLLLLVIVAIKAITWFGANVWVASSTEKAIKKFRDRLFQHIQSLELSQMSRIPTGELIQRCTGDIGTVQKFVGTQIAELIRLGAIAASAFVMMYLVHVPYAFISIAFFLPILWTSYLFFVREQKVWQEHEEEQDQLTAIIQENLSGIRVVQAFAQEEKEIARFGQQNQAKRKIGVYHMDLHMKFWPLSDALVTLQIALSMFAGAYFCLIGSISIGEYASFFSYAIMVTWPMRNLGRIVSQLGMAGVAMERIQQILAAKTEDYSSSPKTALPPLKGKIEFQQVWMAYPNKDKSSTTNWALQDLSFKLEAGEQLGIMGGTGAGKSTILLLLLRFYEPDKGQILLDGHPLSSYDKTYLRQQMGTVLQRPFLFSTSIEANIAYAQSSKDGKHYISASPNKDRTILEAVAQDAAVTDFIPKLTDGYATVVGEKGVGLSGGQKQRVALARTLYSNPSLLLLDDTTSAVDTATEKRLQQAIGKRTQGKTTLIVAHRLTSVQYADKILVLDAGKCLQWGSPQTLLQEEGFYKQVYDLQTAVD